MRNNRRIKRIKERELYEYMKRGVKSEMFQTRREKEKIKDTKNAPFSTKKCLLNYAISTLLVVRSEIDVRKNRGARNGNTRRHGAEEKA